MSELLYVTEQKKRGMALSQCSPARFALTSGGARENRIGDSYDFLLNGLTESSNPAQSHSFHNKINKQNPSQKIRSKIFLPLLESSTNHPQNN
jgi:hypothetical protein